MSIPSKPLNLLLVEDNPGDLMLFKAYLEQVNLDFANVQHTETLSTVNSFAKKDFDIAFLDLSLPDSQGTETFKHLNELIPNVPIVVLSGLTDENVAVDCIAMGAQDYLVKDDLNAKLLEKSIQYSIERKRNLKRLKESVAQYQLIGQITNDIIWRWDFSTNEIKSPAQKFFDYNADSVEKNFDWWKSKIHPGDRNLVLSNLQNLVEGKIDNAQVEHRFQCADGSYKYVFNRAFLLRNDQLQPYAVVGGMMDITERRKLQAELLKQEIDHQKQLTEATIQGQEKEKEQIGKELHDNVTQILTSIKLYLETAIGQEYMKEELLNKCRENTVMVIDHIRKLSHSLIPPSLGDHGLIDAITELVDEINMIGIFKIELSVENFDEDALDCNKKLMLFRIVQEQMSNIIKYSKAQKVSVSLKMSESKLMLTIMDNGVGFDTTKKAKGIGLKNIDSRVSYYSGEVELISSPGNGTSLEVFLPV